jgi:replicative DNA helicase
MTDVRSLAQLLEHVDDNLRSGVAATARTWATGFAALDKELGGGLHAGELTLLGGSQGLGKTTFALQIARNVAAGGGRALYLCFEHREEDVLQRVLGMELGLAGGIDAPSLNDLRHLCRASQDGGLVERLAGSPFGVAALASLASLGQRLDVVTIAGGRTELADVRALVQSQAHGRPVVVIDYLQKVRVPGDVSDEDERVTQVVEGLKDLALETDLPVLAIVAADKAGLGGGRTRLHHLRGSTALAYEADVALLLNDKFSIVARHHLMFGTTNAERYKEWVVCSVEKNRAGRDGVDVEFRKLLSHGHFDPTGQPVTEQLLDDRIHVE